MNKTDLAEIIAAECRVTKRSATDMIDTFASAVTDALKRGNGVLISRFGRFDTYHRKARMGRDPQTGAGIKIPGRRAARFVPAGELRNAVGKRK